MLADIRRAPWLSTLRSHVEALGWKLALSARFGDDEILISDEQAPAARSASDP